ncbi:MAG: ATP-binding protein [Saprospiraceae bacterium]|nr:response regulator [Lewinella sp.]
MNCSNYFFLPITLLVLCFGTQLIAQENSSSGNQVFTLVDTFPYGGRTSPFHFFGDFDKTFLEVRTEVQSATTFEALQEGLSSVNWEPVELNREFEKSTTYWFRFKVFNTFDQEKEAWMWIWNRSWKELEVFLPDQNGHYEGQHIEPEMPPEEKELPYWMPFFQVKMKARDTLTVFFRLRSIAPDLLAGRVVAPKITQVDPRSFTRNLPFRTYYTGLMHGFLIIQFLFFAIIYLITKDKTVLYLAVFLAGYALYDLHESIFKEEFNPFYWGYESYWAIFLRFPATLIFGYGLMKFVEAYADLPSIYPGVSRWINGFMVVFIIISILAYMDENTVYPIKGIFIFQYYRICALLFFLFVIITPVIALYHRKPYAKVLLIGMAPIPIAGFVGIFMVLGFLPSFMPYRDIFRMGTALSMILLSVGAGYRINTLRHREIELGKTKEFDTLKNQFYTNITHEFRTPLTVIQGTTEQIQTHPKEKEIIRRNSQNLLDLVNRMLDLAKIEAGKLHLHMIQGDILSYLRYITESFHSLALNQKINLNFYADQEELIMDYDPEKILQILSNLISNALKFTREYGKVTITARAGEKAGKAVLMLRVKDTGIGIEAEQLPHIFDRFHQVEAGPTRRAEGTGIGLALTKGLVEQMNGEITVKSQLGEGSTFSVLLPISNQATWELVDGDSDWKALSIPEAVQSDTLLGKSTDQPEFGNEEELPQLLLVEDNLDVMQFIASCLSPEYKLLFARNGREGIDLALEHIPDVIISDVMMPEVDGFELCSTLKQEERTSHIPIILLTAKADMASKLEGLEYGADAYLVKPFYREELEIRLRKLIELRRKLRERYNQPHFEPDPATEKEDAFVLKVRQLILEHLKDDPFGPQELSDLLYMHRSHLYRKLKALTDRSPSIFIRQIRLQEAHRMLLERDLSIKEIAYSVGFSDPAYFSKLFSQTYGQPPSSV